MQNCQNMNGSFRIPNHMNCGCNRTASKEAEDPLKGMPLAMAYVPWQQWECPYDASKGFCRGTIFEALDKPFMPKGGMMR